MNSSDDMAVCEAGPVWSYTSALDELFLPLRVPDEAVYRLSGDPDWLRTWTTGLKAGKAKVIVTVRDLARAPRSLSVPVRRFSRTGGQKHRPGPEFLVSTGRQHGFESLAERRLLLALDFAGGVQEVLSQPFRLRFALLDGADSHPRLPYAGAGGGLATGRAPGRSDRGTSRQTLFLETNEATPARARFSTSWTASGVSRAMVLPSAAAAPRLCDLAPSMA
ncbi:hypothetical protein ACFVWX_33260 [Streptomyces sp. NPDC058220]|uniref:hypothetical protein n=1 Tax=Streptomyces sp. NPDC058220 TaxID=3346387 RepID=UPI0036E51ECD